MPWFNRTHTAVARLDPRRTGESREGPPVRAVSKGREPPFRVDAPLAPLPEGCSVFDGARPRPAFTRGTLDVMSGLYRLGANRVAGIERIQVEGIDRLLNAHGRLPEGPLVWMFSHTDGLADALTLMGLRNRCPRVEDGQAGHRLVPHFLMRATRSLPERLLTKHLFGFLVTHVETEKHAAEETSEQTRLRQERNHRRVKAQASEVLEMGEHQVLFPEGRTDGDGTIRLDKVGAVRAFSEHRGHRVPILLGTLTYEPLTGASPKLILNLDGPLVLKETESKDALCRAFEKALARLNTLTISGIVGARLLGRRASRPGEPISLTRAELERWVDHVVDRARMHPELRIDLDLLDPASRSACVRSAHERLHRLGYLDDADVLTSKLGKAADLSRDDTPREDRAKHLHRYDPLRYWGNRTRQHAQHEPKLREILADEPPDAAGRALASNARGAPAPPRRAESCVIS